MKCSRCGKRIREAYYISGKPYGIECAKIRGYKDKKITIKKNTKENENQMRLL